MSEHYTVGPDIDLDVEKVHLPDGTRLTEQKAEQIAEEEQEKVRRAGRPSLSGGDEHSPHLSFRVPEQLHRDAVTVAEREGRSVSAVAREALERYVAAQER